jgi:hypothetical protein
VNLALSPAVLPAEIAGQNYSATITARGGSGNYNYTLVSGTLPKGLSLSSGGVLSGIATVAGLYSFTVKATDVASGVSGTQVYSLKVSPAVMWYTVSAPSRVTAGTGFAVTVTAKDQYGNAYSGPVTLASSDGQPVTPAAATLVNGTATIQVFLKTAGTVTLTANGNGLKGTSNSIVVSPAAAASLTVSAPTRATAGTGFNVTITARDAYGNVATGYNGTVKLYCRDSQTPSPATVTLVNGTVQAIVTLKVAHTLTLTVGDGRIDGTSGLITVSPGVAASVVVSAPSKALAGVGFYVTLTVKDAYGNGCTGPVTLTSSDGQAVTPGSTTVTNGVATVLVTLKSPGTFKLMAAVVGVTGTSQLITILGK